MKRAIAVILSVILFQVSAYAQDDHSSQDRAVFEEIFNQWTNAFNQKQISSVCGLFSPAVIASYQGLPPKNYDVICEGFKRIFADKKKVYKYHFNLHQVYLSGNMAAVRISWYLDIQEPNKPTTSGKDEGLDILQKDASGNWKIINYLAYPVIENFNPISLLHQV